MVKPRARTPRKKTSRRRRRRRRRIRPPRRRFVREQARVLRSTIITILVGAKNGRFKGLDTRQSLFVHAGER